MCLLNLLSEMEIAGFYICVYIFFRAVGGLALKVESSLVNFQD